MRRPPPNATPVFLNGAWCDLWRGSRNTNGYGTMRVGEKVVLVHRMTYRLTHGRIPIGKEIGHLCHVRNCREVKHLQPMTHRENCQAVGERRRTSTNRQGAG